MTKSDISLKDRIIKKIAIKMRISEPIIKDVIDDQFRSITKAMVQHNSVEITGFGTFYFLPRRAELLVKGLTDAMEKKIAGEAVPRVEKDIPTLRKEIDYLNQKIKDARESKTNSRGVEKCSIKG